MPPSGLLNDGQLLHRATEEILRGRQGVVHKIQDIVAGAGSYLLLHLDTSNFEELFAAKPLSHVDHGDGAPADFVPRLFTKFASRSVRGTGLGLYISKNIVEAHYGRIWYEKRRSGKGAVFAFRLPLSS